MPLSNGTTPWADAENEQLRALHAAGKSLNAIATEMGRAKGTISKYAAQLGLDFDRSRTAKAAEAVRVDNKARRTSIVARVYDEAEALLTELEDGRAGKGWRTILKGEFGVEEARTLDFIPPVDRRSHSDALNRTLMTATKLEAVDAAQQSSGVRDLLTGLGERLGLSDAS